MQLYSWSVSRQLPWQHIGSTSLFIKKKFKTIYNTTRSTSTVTYNIMAINEVLQSCLVNVPFHFMSALQFPRKMFCLTLHCTKVPEQHCKTLYAWKMHSCLGNSLPFFTPTLQYLTGIACMKNAQWHPTLSYILIGHRKKVTSQFIASSQELSC